MAVLMVVVIAHTYVVGIDTRVETMECQTHTTRHLSDRADGQSVGWSLVFHKSPKDEIQLDTYLKDRRSERGVSQVDSTFIWRTDGQSVGWSLVSQVTNDKIRLNLYLNDTDGQSVGGAWSFTSHPWWDTTRHLSERQTVRAWGGACLTSHQSPNDEIHHSLSFSIILYHHRWDTTRHLSEVQTVRAFSPNHQTIAVAFS
jgi:hypothetical protein